VVLQRAAADLRAGRAPDVAAPDLERFERARASADAGGTAEAIVPIGEFLAGTAEQAVVRAAPNPPMTARARFRAEMVGHAEHLRRLVGEARAAVDLVGRARVGHELERTLRTLERTAASFGEGGAASYFGRMAGRARTLDPQLLGEIDAAGATLAGARPGPAGGAAGPSARAPQSAPPRSASAQRPGSTDAAAAAPSAPAPVAARTPPRGATPVAPVPTNAPAPPPAAAPEREPAPTPPPAPAVLPAAHGTPAPRPALGAPGTGSRRRTPSGRELQSMLQEGLAGLGQLESGPFAERARDARRAARRRSRPRGSRTRGARRWSARARSATSCAAAVPTATRCSRSCSTSSTASGRWASSGGAAHRFARGPRRRRAGAGRGQGQPLPPRARARGVGLPPARDALQRVELADDVHVRATDGGRSLDVRGADVGPVERNLAWRAAGRRTRRAPAGPAGFAIEIEKRIPVGRRDGGRERRRRAPCCARSTRSRRRRSRPGTLLGLAAGLGADVPFLTSRARARAGVGDAVSACSRCRRSRRATCCSRSPPRASPPPTRSPGSPPAATARRRPSRECSPRPRSTAGNAVGALAVNDFEPACCPGTRARPPPTPRSGAAGHPIVLLSGSGATVFAVTGPAAGTTTVAEGGPAVQRTRTVTAAAAVLLDE
jgi:4-diphosphocytidyl-2C-methyl-D-erythritol kinase